MNGIIRSPVDGLAVHMPKHKRENFSAANCYRHHTRGSKLSSSFFLQLFLVCVFVCNLQFAICKTKANHKLPAWKIKQNPCCEMFENDFYVLDWFLCLRMMFHNKLCSPPLHSPHRFRHGTTSAFGASCLTKDFPIRKSAICCEILCES